MPVAARRIFISLALAMPALAAFADDCTTAIIATAQRPLATVSTKTDAQGKQTTSRSLQTETTQYVQTSNGQWHSIGMSLKERFDLQNEQMKTSKITCQRAGTESVNGEMTTAYAVHVDNQGSVSESRIWISSKSLILKSETTVAGAKFVTLYDYAHLTPPANAEPLGKK